MRFFCIQPDIVEDAKDVRYHTKSKSVPTKVVHPVYPGTARSTNAPAIVPITDIANASNRSRTNLTNVLTGGKKLFHHHSHHSAEQRKLSIGNPIPIPTPPNTNVLTASNTNVTVPVSKPPTVKPKSFDGSARPFTETKALTDTEGLGGRRKSRRLSTPFTAMKLGGEDGAISGNESGTGGKTKRRVSKLAIGNPEGFRHEAHMGVDDTFGVVPQERGIWSVETWRAEIERTMEHSSSPATVGRPKGPRPTSIEPPARKRGSVDGAAPRRSVDRERDIPKRTPERDRTPPRWSNEQERDGALSDYPIGRPVTAPTRGNTNPSSREARHSRSRSGSSTGPNTGDRPPQVRRNQTYGPASSSHASIQGHVPGKESINSIASTPTTATTMSSAALITPTTTTSSLARSLSDKPHPPVHYHQHPHHYHSHSHHGYVQGNQATHALGDGVVTYGQGIANGPLQRASSANAAVPSSTHRPLLPPSSSNSTSTATSHGSSTTIATRKPIPAQRRKPVPQHLPATAEVSPFPTLLVVKDKDKDKSKDGTSPGNAHAFPFDINPVVEKQLDANTHTGTRWKDADGKTKKEMVPLLGVPSDGAQYVTKSTKARWDGAMAEIATALRDPDATPPI